MSMEPTMRGFNSQHGVRRTNPLRVPEIIAAIREFIITEGKGAPGKPSGHDILTMVARRFRVFAGKNQLVAALSREGISRGWPVRKGPNSPKEPALRQHRASPRPTPPLLADLTEERRLAEQNARRFQKRQKGDRQRLEAGPDPEMTVTPQVARQHDIAQFMREHPAHRQHQSSLADVQSVTFRAPPLISKASSRPRECCWPIGEVGAPDFRYCDAPHANAGPYCDEHHRIAFVRVGKSSGEFELKSPMAPR